MRRSAATGGRRRDLRSDHTADGFGAVSGQCGPVLDSGVGTLTQHGWQCSGIANRVVRSTNVPIAELFRPMTRSPSQWRTARSATSAGRWLIITSGVMNCLPRCRVQARGTRNARPVRRQADSSQRSAPLPCTIERLVDGFVGDTHGCIMREVDSQSAANLQRAPAVPQRQSARRPWRRPFHGTSDP